MKIVETRLLRGPNIHSDRPVLQAIVDLEDLDEVSSAMLPGFADRLVGLMPTLDEHRCSLGRRGGFVERLHEGTYMAHIVEHVLLELQCLAGPEVGYGKARMVRGRPRHYRIVCSYRIEPLVREALPLAIELVQALARGAEFAGYEQRLAALRGIAGDTAPGPSTRAILEAAAQRGIPVLRLAEDTSLYQLGWGARAQRIRATVTGQTSQIAADIASDKQLTKQLLAEAGLPVPRGELVLDADAAVAAMGRLGGPVAIKPLDANQGKGVSVDVRDEPAARAAFERAREWSRRVIVEAFVEGEDHRVLVVGDRVVAASRRRPPSVTGDGRRSVRELLEAENADPRRGSGHGSALTRIPLDAAALEELARQGLAPEAVPAAGVAVRLRGNGNLSTGGTAEDVTDRLHPDTARACVRAAAVVGLDVAGIDLVCTDTARPLHSQRGAIIEVNAAPGIRMHEHPSSGLARHAGAAIVDRLFPQGQDGRIPTVAITGTNGKTTTTLAVSRVMRAAGHRTGTTTSEGVFIDGEAIARGDCTGYWSARMLLTAPEVEAAVLETARGGILKRGLAFDHCDVGVVLNVQDDHLGHDGVDTLEELAWAKGLLVRCARRAAVLNADDRMCVEAVARDVPEGVETIWFTMDAANDTVRRHLARGGRAVLLHEGAIVLAEGERRTPLVDARRLSFTLGGLARHNVANALACAAAAWGAGLAREPICEGLVNFHTTSAENPLRLNLFRVRGTTVLLDFAHNPAAYRAMGETARLLSGGRLVGLVAVPDDRREDELVEVGRVCAGRFDHLVIYEMEKRRGRTPGEAARLIAEGALAGGMAPERLEVIPQLARARPRALELCGPGDVLLYGCASHVGDLVASVPEGVEELVVLERRRAHLAPYAEGLSVDTPTRTRTSPDWDPSMPERRIAPQRPYIVAAAQWQAGL